MKTKADKQTAAHGSSGLVPTDGRTCGRLLARTGYWCGHFRCKRLYRTVSLFSKPQSSCVEIVFNSVFETIRGAKGHRLRR